MPPHDQEIRMKVIHRHLKEKQSMAKISSDLGISYTCIRSWVKRYKEKGEEGLFPKYTLNSRPSKFRQEVLDQAFEYKKTHPKWGAPFILIKLEDDFPKTPLPKTRWLQQLFKRAGLQPQKTKLPEPKIKWAKQVFDCVQVDAKEKLKTADGKDCCYLNFVDEYSGSELDAFLFPLCSD